MDSVLADNLDIPTKEARSLLVRAESLYGPREEIWTFAGVVVRHDGPMLLFPEASILAVAISDDALQDEHKRLFQLSHEVVHLLSPQRAFKDAPMLEEGVAVRFSLDGPNYADHEYRRLAEEDIRTNPANVLYAEALDIADRVLSTQPDAIKRLRLVEPAFWAITPELLADFGVDKDTAKRACERVQMRPRL